MKKFYHLLIVLLGLFAMTTTNLLAQNTSGRAYVGYAMFDSQIWEYDGLSLDRNAKVGCAIVLTREMLEPYIGGTIVSLRAGWDTSTQTGKYDGFVRNTFNGENLSTGSGTVSYNYSSSYPGWNNITMTDYQIPDDVEQLVVGFTTTLKKDVCAIPILNPRGIENSCFLWVEGDNDEQGNPIWRDMHNEKDQYGNKHGMLPIILGIKDTQGTFNYIPTITLLTHNGVITTKETNDCLIRLRNDGSQNITSMNVTWRQGDEKWTSNNVTANILIGRTSNPFLIPMWCFHSGDLEMSITKINGNDLPNPQVHKMNVIGVPREVDEAYIRRPLVEYYESENSYMSARYYDEIVAPSLKGKLDDMTLVCQHLDDQFMTGEDDATVLALRLCDNDSSQVSIPCMTIDRAMATDNISYQISSTSNPMFSVLYEPYASETLNASLTHPTFLNVEVSGKVQDDGTTLQVTVGGDIANGVMPEGEQPRLTVYLMERNVDTDSQIFWTEKEKEEYTGHYTHANVIREILTDAEGDVINAEGEISAMYSTELISDWNYANLYLVAFVHRDGSRGGKFMHVFNSCEGKITFPTGIEKIKDGDYEAMRNEVFDLSGRRVSHSLQKGLYIKNRKKVVVR